MSEVFMNRMLLWLVLSYVAEYEVVRVFALVGAVISLIRSYREYLKEGVS